MEKGLQPITPDVVDSWESWQAAAFLGIGLPDDDEEGDGPVRNLALERAEYFAALQAGEDPEPPSIDAPSGPPQTLMSLFDGQAG